MNKRRRQRQQAPAEVPQAVMQQALLQQQAEAERQAGIIRLHENVITSVFAHLVLANCHEDFCPEKATQLAAMAKNIGQLYAPYLGAQVGLIDPEKLAEREDKKEQEEEQPETDSAPSPIVVTGE